MRIIGRFPNGNQVSFCVDSLKNIGFDRKDMIISTMEEEQQFNSIEDASREISLIKTERESLNDIGTFINEIKGLQGKSGIVVAVETPKNEAVKVRTIMEQSGAIEIVQD